MQFGDLVFKGCIALLSGYLSLTGSLADAINDQLARMDFETPFSRVAVTRPVSILTTLPSRYTLTEAIPRILLDNLEYQQAAIAGAGTTRENTHKQSPAEDAIVNILCSYTLGNEIHTTTGSGVFIDARGVILTNAHVAQYLILGESHADATCTIRQGNPAKDRYHADILYISPLWVSDNAVQIDATSPAGTGERDYALLFITDAIDGEMPTEFPALTIDTQPLSKNHVGTDITAAGYPAGSFRTEGPEAPLIPKIGATKITNLFTFGSGEADLVSIGPSSVGEQGSSGGPIINSSGSVIGLIVTRGNDEHDGPKSLRAITLPYINTTIQEETGFDLRTTLEGNLPRRSAIFKNALIPFLARMLNQEFES